VEAPAVLVPSSFHDAVDEALKRPNSALHEGFRRCRALLVVPGHHGATRSYPKAFVKRLYGSLSPNVGMKPAKSYSSKRRNETDDIMRPLLGSVNEAHKHGVRKTNY